MSDDQTQRRAGRDRPRSMLYFDLASPYTYLAAERADRDYPALRWVPATCPQLRCGPFSCAASRAAVDARATELGLPLLWPPSALQPHARAMRIASLAARQGHGAAFVLALTRLQFCGSYDIDDDDVLLQAAAAAGLDHADALHAAADAEHDREIAETARSLVASGVTCLPALRHDGTLHSGEHRMPASSAPRSGSPGPRPSRRGTLRLVSVDDARAARGRQQP